MRFLLPRSALAILLIGSVFVISACGNKGPLSLPSPETSQQQS
ncbi:MAG: lipoprotein [Gammaproteobacteria bacterium]|nr:lipoprotein [Gammaproteobacteria bacterium]